MRTIDSECGHRGCTADSADTWFTIANLITGARVIAVVVLCGFAVNSQRPDSILAAGLLVYWIGDMADGAVARILNQETRTGAVLDVLGDRLSVTLLVGLYISGHPSAALPAVIFLLQFGLLDAYLSTVFLRWSLSSANYFDLVDKVVYALNWSPLAKALNTSVVVLLWLVTANSTIVTSVACVAMLMKVASAVRIAGLVPPLVRSGCAADERFQVAPTQSVNA